MGGGGGGAREEKGKTVTVTIDLTPPRRQDGALIYDTRGSYISQLSDLKLCIKLSLKVKSRRDQQTPSARYSGATVFSLLSLSSLSTSIRILMENSPRVVLPTREGGRRKGGGDFARGRKSRAKSRASPCADFRRPRGIRRRYGIFWQFSGQIVPQLAARKLAPNTEDNPRGLLRYHVGPYVLSRARGTLVFVCRGIHLRVCIARVLSMETLARGRARCDTLIPKSVAISPRYNK